MAELSERKLLPTRKVCQRYGVVDRTISRWERDTELKFPKPIIINYRKYFDEEELAAFDRALANQPIVCKPFKPSVRKDSEG
jgi:predicted DNA-binding transcriptional regulator AlpA